MGYAGYRLLVVSIATIVVACSPMKKKKDVWDLYDLRYPVPAGHLPPSKAEQYNRYIDNDAFYTPPTFGMCGGSNMGINCGAE